MELTDDEVLAILDATNATKDNKLSEGDADIIYKQMSEYKRKGMIFNLFANREIKIGVVDGNCAFYREDGNIHN